MKATLTFKLPDEMTEYNSAVHGAEYRCALNDINEYLRSQVKYNTKLNDEQVQVIERIREELFAILSSYDLEI